MCLVERLCDPWVASFSIPSLILKCLCPVSQPASMFSWVLNMIHRVWQLKTRKQPRYPLIKQWSISDCLLEQQNIMKLWKNEVDLYIQWHGKISKIFLLSEKYLEPCNSMGCSPWWRENEDTQNMTKRASIWKQGLDVCVCLFQMEEEKYREWALLHAVASTRRPESRQPCWRWGGSHLQPFDLH